MYDNTSNTISFSFSLSTITRRTSVCTVTRNLRAEIRSRDRVYHGAISKVDFSSVDRYFSSFVAQGRPVGKNLSSPNREAEFTKSYLQHGTNRYKKYLLFCVPLMLRINVEKFFLFFVQPSFIY